MKNIIVKKSKLVTILKKNRDEHRGIFLAAQKAYRGTVINVLDEELKLAREGRPFNLRRIVSLQAPEDHTAEYDRVIGMLELDTTNEVELNSQDYQLYVEDQWGWMHSFASNVTSYGVSSPKMASFVQE